MNEPLKEFQEALGENAGFDYEAPAKGLCGACGLPAIPRCYSDDGRKEFYISGLCEICFDEACKEED